MYYNTTSETGITLAKYLDKTLAQEKAVLLCLKSFDRNRGLSASEIWKRLNRPNEPLTSTRRSLSDLQLENKVVKRNVKIIGMYGRPEHLWMLCS